MVLRIKETELRTVNLKLVDEVLLVNEGDALSGIPVWHARRLPLLYSANTPAEAREHRQVAVVVDDPEDKKTQERIATQCFELYKSGTGDSGG